MGHIFYNSHELVLCFDLNSRNRIYSSCESLSVCHVQLHQKSGGLIWILFYTFLHAFDHIPRYLKATHYDEHGYHYFLYYIFFMETESVSEVTGSHDMEAIEKKNHN